LDARVIDLAATGLLDPLSGQKDLRDLWLAAPDADWVERLERAADEAAPARADGEIHNSQPIGIVNYEFVNFPVRAWELPEPPARAWLLPNFLPVGALSIWYGDAGVFKSYIATYLACALAQGASFLGQDVHRCPVLYVDTELDQDEFVRRAYAIARGMGLTRPPVGLFYYRMTRSLADDEAPAELYAMRQGTGAGLVIVDSLTLGSYGANVSDIDVATKVLAGLKALGTVLALDHIPRPIPGANLSTYRPFGSMAKYAEARCITQILKAETGDGVVMRPVKSNFSRLGSPAGVSVSFTGDTVMFARVDVAAIPGAEEHLPALERVYVALAQRGEDGAAPGELASELGLSDGRVRNYLTALKRQGRVETERGRWRARNSQIHNSQHIGVVNCEFCEVEEFAL
jgi:hypothetical protein